MTGLLQAQNGRPDRAFPVWAALLEDTPADSPWNIAIRQVIEDMAWLAGKPEQTGPAAHVSALGLREPDGGDAGGRDGELLNHATTSAGTCRHCLQ